MNYSGRNNLNFVVVVIIIDFKDQTSNNFTKFNLNFSYFRCFNYHIKNSKSPVNFINLQTFKDATNHFNSTSKSYSDLDFNLRLLKALLK